MVKIGKQVWDFCDIKIKWNKLMLNFQRYDNRIFRTHNCNYIFFIRKKNINYLKNDPTYIDINCHTQNC